MIQFNILTSWVGGIDSLFEISEKQWYLKIKNIIDFTKDHSRNHKKRKQTYYKKLNIDNTFHLSFERAQRETG